LTRDIIKLGNNLEFKNEKDRNQQNL